MLNRFRRFSIESVTVQVLNFHLVYEKPQLMLRFLSTIKYNGSQNSTGMID
jgi:hypothetical protein